MVGVIPGRPPAVLIGAHYDTEYHPEGFVGANDGAAGNHASTSDLEAAASRACTYTLWSSPRAIKVTITDEPP